MMMLYVKVVEFWCVLFAIWNEVDVYIVTTCDRLGPMAHVTSKHLQI